VTGRPAPTAGRGGSLVTQQSQELIGAHRGGRASPHVAHKPLTPGRAGLNPDDAQGIAILDDVHLVAFVQTMSLAQRSGNRYLALTVQPQRNLP
jgi:hypothetical protein